jgi:cytochrome c oxidase assembly protein subunit 15
LKINKNINISNKINPSIPFLLLILIFTQIVIGAFVSGMDAGKIYNSWPFMGTTYFPNDNDFSNLFKLSAFSDPSLVQFIHRNLAYLIGIFYLFIFYKIYINKMVDLYKSINIVGCFILLQVILGILTILFGAQIYIASMHQISSIFLVSSCIYLFYINTNLTYRF